MTALKNVERLFFQNNLLVGTQIVWNRRLPPIRKDQKSLRHRLRNHFRSGCTAHAMGREPLKLRIVRRMNAYVRNQKNAILARLIGEPAR